MKNISHSFIVTLIIFSFCLNIQAQDSKSKNNDIVTISSSINTDTIPTLTDSANLKKDSLSQNKTYLSNYFKIYQKEILQSHIHSSDPMLFIQSKGYGTNPFENGGLNLRGSSTNESMTYINGVPIFQTTKHNRLFALKNRSILNAQTIDRLEVFTMSSNSTYSRNDGSGVNIYTIDSIQKNNMNFAVSLGEASLNYNKKLNKKGDHFIQLFGNFQFSPLQNKINPKATQKNNSYQNYDLGLNYRTNLSKNTHLNIYSYVNIGVDSFLNYKNLNQIYKDDFNRHLHILNLSHQSKKSEIIFNAKFDKNELITKENYNHVFVYKYENIFGEIAYRYKSNDINLQVGVDYENYFPKKYGNVEFEPIIKRYNDDIFNKSDNFQIYAQVNVFLLPNLYFELGGRKILYQKENKIEHMTYSGKIRYQIKNSQNISFNTGKFYLPFQYNIPNNNILNNNYSIDYEIIKKNWGANAGIFSRSQKMFLHHFYGYEINEPKLNSLGADLNVTFRFKKHFELESSYQYIDGKFSNNDESISYSQNALKIAANYSNNRILNISIFYTNRSTHQIVEPLFLSYFLPNIQNLEKLKYNSLNLSLNRVFKLKKLSLKYFIQVHNVLDNKNDGNIYYFQNPNLLITYQSPRFIQTGIQFSL